MTPHGMRYEEAFAKAHPFDRLVEGMLSDRMLDEAAAIMHQAIAAGRNVTVIVNNRAGGNAPLIAERLVERFLRPGTD
jgi:phosphoheptose isomerase